VPHIWIVAVSENFFVILDQKVDSTIFGKVFLLLVPLIIILYTVSLVLMNGPVTGTSAAGTPTSVLRISLLTEIASSLHCLFFSSMVDD
jgi:uncharacterized membrane protein